MDVMRVRVYFCYLLEPLSPSYSVDRAPTVKMKSKTVHPRNVESEYQMHAYRHMILNTRIRLFLVCFLPRQRTCTLRAGCTQHESPSLQQKNSTPAGQ
jgi:hypothetical protein